MTSRSIIEGPAAIVFNGFTYYAEGDITVTPSTDSRVIQSSLHGPVSRRQTDRSAAVAFTPVGQLSSLSAYFPYGPSDLGSLIAPAADTDAVIWSAAGVKLTLKAAVITQPPDLILATDRGPLGQMTITAMGGLSKAAGADSSLFDIASAALSAAALDTSSILTPGYKAELLDADSQVIQTLDSEDGFTFSPGLTLTPRKVNAYGTVNFRLTSAEPRLTFTPVGPDEASALALLLLQGASAGGLGAPSTLGRRLKVSPVSGSGATVEFPDCQASEGALQYSASSPRLSQWSFTPAYATGAPLYTIAFPA